jgi:alcohol dehydrogenase (NADP+)
MDSFGYAALGPAAELTPFEFVRRDPGPGDVVLDLLYCGMCHSDLHFVNNDWGFSSYPLVPGHEIVGRVQAVGAEVTKFSVGDLTAVGCLIDSCRTCPACRAGEEQACVEGPTPTYGGVERGTRTPTYGGYSTNYVVREEFALKVPASLDPPTVAPLLCAGITTYSALRHWEVAAGDRVGVVGLGGLGHMAVKLAAAMGAEVVLLTTSRDKEGDARRLGAHQVVISTDRTQMREQRGSLKFVLDTVSAAHDINAELSLVARDGTLCLVGMPDAPAPIAVSALVGGRKQLAGSAIGGLVETQEMLDFCAEHGVAAEVEVVGIAEVQDAFERMVGGKVRYRSVIDIASLHEA